MSILYIDTEVLRRESSKVDAASDDMESISGMSSPDLGASTAAVTEAIRELNSTSTDLASRLTSAASDMRTAADDFADADEAAAQGAHSTGSEDPE